MINISINYEILQYKEPVPVRGTLISENRFLKVTLLEVDYFFSTLPGLHQSSLEEIAFKLNFFFSNYSLNFSEIGFSKRFFNLISSDILVDDFLNSFQNEHLFVIETLLLAMIKKTHPGLFNNNKFTINELYRPTLGPLAYSESKCLKIKIAPNAVLETTKVINELHGLNKDLLFRLDGNRKFDLLDLIVFVEMLKKNIPESAFTQIDYIEEPLKVFYDTFLFQKRSPLKIAIDESFSTLIDSSESNFPVNTPVVIKPSLFGISTIYKWMQTHTKNRIIISGSFEHPSVKIGLDFLAGERPYEFHGLENFL